MYRRKSSAIKFHVKALLNTGKGHYNLAAMKTQTFQISKTDYVTEDMCMSRNKKPTRDVVSYNGEATYRHFFR